MAEEKKVILGVGAHADDMDFMASGTIAKFIEEGYEGYYLVCTDGSRGSADPEMTHQKLSNIRKEEQIAAGSVLGLTDVFFLTHTDTQLVSDTTLKEEIVRSIRRLKPSIVITMDPACLYERSFALTDTSVVNHTDHRAVGEATMDAVFPLARDRLTFPEHIAEGLEEYRVSELWFVCFAKKEYIVDISSTLDKKLAAIKCHASQVPDFEEKKKRGIYTAETFGREKGYTYGESFVRLIMP